MRRYIYFFYTSCSLRQENLFDGDCSENLNISSLREDQNLDDIDEKKISIKEVEQDHVLTKFEGLEDKKFEERPSIEDNILEFLEELKRKIWSKLGRRA